MVSGSLVMPDPSITEINQLIDQAVEAHRSNPIQGIALADEAIALATAMGFESGVAQAYRARAMCHGAQGKPDEALADFRQALNRSRELHDLPLEAQCLHGIGQAHFHRAEYALALERMYEALIIRHTLGRDVNLAATLNGLAAIHGTLGNYADATACNIQAFEIAQAEGNLTSMQATLGHRGILLAEVGDYAGAVAAYTESIRLAEELNHRLNLVGTLGNISSVLCELGRYEEAVAAAERSVSLATEFGNTFRIAQANLKRAIVYEKMGRFDEVDTAYQMLWEHIEGGVSDTHTIGILVEIGAYYLRRGKYAMSRAVLTHTLNLLDNQEQIKFLCECHRLLSRLSSAEGDFKTALEHYQEFHRLNETLQKQAAENLLVAQKAKLEVERAQQDAEIHRLKNIELVEANRQKSDLLEKLEKHRALLARQAITDPLTGLYNRRYFHDFLEQELTRREQKGTPLAVLIADLDNFKQINDRFSHAVGDIVLKTVANLFREGFRENDVIARYGGEEFVVVLPETNAPETASIANRVRATIEAYPWKDVHPELVVTTSIGVADERLENADNLLMLADKRLYEAKRSGKNRVVYVITDS